MIALTLATDPRPAPPPAWPDLASGLPTELAWSDASESTDLAGFSWQGRDSMHARYYFPYTARFLSVDPGRDYDPKVPQSWNLYAYVRGDPVNAIDPNGRDTYLVNRVLEFPVTTRISKSFTGRSAATPKNPVTHTFIAIVDDRGMVTTFSWGNHPDPHNAHVEGRWLSNEEEDVTAAQQAIALGLAKKIGGADLDPYVEAAFAMVSNQADHPSNHRNLWITRNCKTEANKLLEQAEVLKRGEERDVWKHKKESQKLLDVIFRKRKQETQ